MDLKTASAIQDILSNLHSSTNQTGDAKIHFEKVKKNNTK
jgi:hypothetical protein